MDFVRVENLCSTLGEHLNHYQTLVDYIAREKKFLLAQDLDSLMEASKEKEALALNIKNHISTMMDSIKEVALMLGLSLDPQPLLVDLVKHLPQPYDNLINDGSIKLALIKNIILRENEANRRYIEESQRLVNESLNILTGARQLKGGGYQKDGRQEQHTMALPIKLSCEV